jgi:hypothetical protein
MHHLMRYFQLTRGASLPKIDHLAMYQQQMMRSRLVARTLVSAASRLVSTLFA